MAFSYNYCYSKIKQHCYDDDTSSLWAWDSVAYNTGDTKAHSDTWMKSHRLAYNDQYALAYHAADYLCHDCANARHILKIVLQLVVLHSRHIIHPMVSLVNFLLRPRYGGGVLRWPCLSLCVLHNHVCPRAYLRNYSQIFTIFFVHVTYDCGWVLWRVAICYVLQVFTARCYASAVLAMGLCLCLSVCICLSVSVTSRSSTKTAKRRITQTTPHDSTGL